MAKPKQKVVITCAVTGANHTPSMSPHLPVTADEIAEAERAGLYPWVATRKLRFVRITPDTLTGRRFVFGPEPDHTALVS